MKLISRALYDIEIYSFLARSRCLNSSRNTLQDTLFQNGNSCAAQIIGSDTSSSGSASILTTHEQPSHSGYPLSSYTPDISSRSKDDLLHQLQHHHSLPHQPDNLSASETQSKGKNGIIHHIFKII